MKVTPTILGYLQKLHQHRQVHAEAYLKINFPKWFLAWTFTGIDLHYMEVL